MCGNCHGPQQAHIWQSTGTEMAIKRRIPGSQQAEKWPICGSCSGIQKAHLWHSKGSQQTHTWQSKGTYPMAANRHMHGNQKAHTWQSTDTYMAINQKAHTWQSTGTYVAFTCTHILHTWQLFVHEVQSWQLKGAEIGSRYRHF